MKKNIVLLILLAVVIAACTLLLPDGPAYSVAALMALSVLGTMWAKRSAMRKLTRWAKANPVKTQWTIAGIQLTLIALGLLLGYNLKALDFTFSDATAYLFSLLMIAGFLVLPFRPQRKAITLPAEVNRHRLAYLAIALSGFVLTAFFGNRIGEAMPDALVTRILDKADQAIFSETSPVYSGLYGAFGEKIADVDSRSTQREAPALASLKFYDKAAFGRNDNSQTSVKKAAKAKRKADRNAKKEFRKQLRRAYSAGACVAAVFLIILLIGTTCAGICLFIYGVSETSVAAIIFGPIIAFLSVWAIIKVAKWCKST